MTVAILYLTLGLGLMLSLGYFLSQATKNWLLQRFHADAESSHTWNRILMLAYYLLFTAYLSSSLKPIPTYGVAELWVAVLTKLAPLLWGVGAAMLLIFYLRVRGKTTTNHPSN